MPERLPERSPIGRPRGGRKEEKGVKIFFVCSLAGDAARNGHFYGFRKRRKVRRNVRSNRIKINAKQCEKSALKTIENKKKKPPKCKHLSGSGGEGEI